jgi:hypothetical protein
MNSAIVVIFHLLAFAVYDIFFHFRYLPCGCECKIKASYRKGALSFGKATLRHNHKPQPDSAPLYAANRRLTKEEQQ